MHISWGKDGAAWSWSSSVWVVVTRLDCACRVRWHMEVKWINSMSYFNRNMLICYLRDFIAEVEMTTANVSCCFLCFLFWLMLHSCHIIFSTLHSMFITTLKNSFTHRQSSTLMTTLQALSLCIPLTSSSVLFLPHLLPIYLSSGRVSSKRSL